MRQQDSDDGELLREVSMRRSSLAVEFIGFLKENKKWWLAPIIVSIFVMGALILFGGSAAAPFIYTLF